jgi:hypothetical protein
MPTGYTAIIEDGDGCTFNEYIMGCARAFGALVTMRDKSQSAEIPKEFKPDSYHQREMVKEKAFLEKLHAMTTEEAGAKAADEYREEVDHTTEYNKKLEAIENRYKAMRLLVEAWAPPTIEHTELKKFMHDQIDLCIHDGYRSEMPKQLNAHDWLIKNLARVSKSIKYHEENYRKEIRRCKQRTLWVHELRKSLKEEK